LLRTRAFARNLGNGDTRDDPQAGVIEVQASPTWAPSVLRLVAQVARPKEVHHEFVCDQVRATDRPSPKKGPPPPEWLSTSPQLCLPAERDEDAIVRAPELDAHVARALVPELKVFAGGGEVVDEAAQN